LKTNVQESNSETITFFEKGLRDEKAIPPQLSESKSNY
jgi:hypothetical protein